MAIQWAKDVGPKRGGGGGKQIDGAEGVER